MASSNASSGLEQLAEKSKSRKRKRQQSKLCPHCDTYLALKTFKKHKKLYFNLESGAWLKKGCAQCEAASSTEDQDSHDAAPTHPSLIDLEFSDKETGAIDGTNEVDTANATCFKCDEDESEYESEEVWDDTGENIDFLSDEDPPHFPIDCCEDDSKQMALITWMSVFLLQLQARHYIPDVVLDALLKFLHTFFCVLGKFSDFVNGIATHFPCSLYRLHQQVGFRDSFEKYVVCKKCNTLYQFKDCIDSTGRSKRCSYQAFRGRRRPSHCQTILLKTVELASGRKLLYPLKVYCYQSIQLSLQRFLLQPDFVKVCEQWRFCENRNMLCDIYDGQLWKNFQFVSDKPFLAQPYNYAFTLNVDWFQPFVLTTSSVGVVYLTVSNLPRTLRFKRENIILVGIIPGPTEPKYDINSFLDPLTKELVDFWKGIEMKIHALPSFHLVRAALLCVACDLPAGRKVCGFLSHSANHGCSRCMKYFPGAVGCKDYSGFNREQWQARTNSSHRVHIKEILDCKTISEKSNLESTYGCRYSSLLKLPYFDPPRMLIIDPMHNLYLGSAKYMLKHIWDKCGFLTSGALQKLQESVDSMKVPTDVGRIPRKIETNFSGFTADQFKNWLNIYSIPALYGIVTGEHLECWRHLVLASRLLCKHALSVTDIQLADALLLQYCRRVEHIYGPSNITPNMHLHCHIREVLLDYGPVYGFWLFSYERYNGILGNQPTSNRSIEPQLMRRFNNDNQAFSLDLPEDFSDAFSAANVQLGDARVVGSVSSTMNHESTVSREVILPPKSNRAVFEVSDVEILQQLTTMYWCKGGVADMNSTYLKYSSVTLKGTVFGSCWKKNSNCFVAMAEWKPHLFGEPPTPLPVPHHPESNIRPVKIHYFAKISFSYVNKVENKVVAALSWYQPHPSFSILGKPAQVWSNLFEVGGTYSFVPIECLVHRCAFCRKVINEESVLVVVPLVH